MIVGAAVVRLHLPASHSLKDKRQVVKSVLARLRGHFEVAAAEVDDQDVWQVATLGISCVSNDSGHAHDLLDNAIRYIEESRPDVEITDARVEVQRELE
jgi:uncharacterized protein YlxP (DUF503 family)